MAVLIDTLDIDHTAIPKSVRPWRPRFYKWLAIAGHRVGILQF
jgi:hypothetical protein